MPPVFVNVTFIFAVLVTPALHAAGVCTIGSIAVIVAPYTPRQRVRAAFVSAPATVRLGAASGSLGNGKHCVGFAGRPGQGDPGATPVVQGSAPVCVTLYFVRKSNAFTPLFEKSYSM